MSTKLRNFSDFIEILSSHDGDSVALIDDSSGTKITYSKLITLIKIVSAKLKSVGVKKNDRVLLFDVHNIDWVIHFLSLQCLQAIVVPLDKRLHTDTVQSVEKKVGPSLIISNSYQSKTGSKTIRPFKGDTKTKVGRTFDKILSEFVDAEIPSEIILTSGTWAEPKGVTLTQQNLMANLEATTQAFKADSKERLLSILPLSHAYEQMCGLLMPLYFGASIVYIKELTPVSLKLALKQQKITIIVAVPRVLELLKKGILKKIPKKLHNHFELFVKRARLLPSWLLKILFWPIHKNLAPHLNYLIVGGAPLNQELDHFFQGLGYTVGVGYGLSETSPVISFDNQQKNRKLKSVGRILHNVKFRFNQKNELLVAGPAVFKGYWPDTRSSRWFNTGDVGYLDENNNLILTGRTKSLLVFPSGDKLYLEDIEHIVDQYPQVEESCVLYHEKHSHHGINLLVCAQTIDTVKLIKYTNERLPLSAQVRQVINIFPQKLHRTHTLKLSRNKNWQEYSALLNSQ